MKRVGERPLSSVPEKKSQAYKNAMQQFVKVKCVACMNDFSVTQGKLAVFFKAGKYKCFDCNTKERAEFNANIIALAKRKGLIK